MTDNRLIMEDIKRRVVYERTMKDYDKISNSTITEQRLNISGLLDVLNAMYSSIKNLEEKIEQQKEFINSVSYKNGKKYTVKTIEEENND